MVPYLDTCPCQAVIKISAPHQGPPVIEKCFDRFPICDPTENDQALLDELSNFRALQTMIDKYAGLAPYQIAQVYALRNDAKSTFEWLDRAWSSRDGGIQYLLYDPLILRFKNDPRFASFCRKVGLPVPAEKSTRPP